jgi:hypothetical protein
MEIRGLSGGVLNRPKNGNASKHAASRPTRALLASTSLLEQVARRGGAQQGMALAAAPSGRCTRVAVAGLVPSSPVVPAFSRQVVAYRSM